MFGEPLRDPFGVDQSTVQPGEHNPFANDSLRHRRVWWQSGPNHSRSSRWVRRKACRGSTTDGSSASVRVAVSVLGLGQPAFDVAGAEAEEVSPFEVGDASFVDQSADMSDLNAEGVGYLNDVEQSSELVVGVGGVDCGHGASLLSCRAHNHL